MNRSIILTETDLERLSRLLNANRAGHDLEPSLARLEDELAQAEVVPSTEIPPNVVTMRSRVRARDLRTGEELVFSVVYPGEANLKEHRISVLAPLGAGLLGYRVGDSIEWPVPGGNRLLRIEEILFQPEAEGQFDL